MKDIHVDRQYQGGDCAASANMCAKKLCRQVLSQDKHQLLPRIYGPANDLVDPPIKVVLKNREIGCIVRNGR